MAAITDSSACSGYSSGGSGSAVSPWRGFTSSSTTGVAINALCRSSGPRNAVSARHIREGRIHLSGGSIAYTVAGDGPALLLIHGLGGNRGTWRQIIGTLARTHTVIAPDLPGHGESDAPAGDYSLGAHACALRDLLLSLGHRRFSLVGHSLGGGIALQTAYQFPERIDRLILIGSGGLGSEVSIALRAATLPGADAVIAALSAIPPAVTNRALAVLPKSLSGPDASLLSGLLYGLRGTKRRTAFLRTARSVIDWRGQAVSAQRQTALLHGVPVLVAWGADDTTIPPHHHRAFAERVPAALTVEIPGAGHYPHETASAQLLPPMQAFLSSTVPFSYSEESWVDRLTHPDIRLDSGGTEPAVRPDSSSARWTSAPGRRRVLPPLSVLSFLH
ncbi:hydrolase [Mycobacterium kubicae]|uniref:Hydrolase n=1 Tax=Mycobacterium kubicae TaxID=120959 RepID=A0ABQ1BL49_9MYCO|nr:alpha/beta fold hydrolase [Mycobacterium kubicae]GFG64426.1 hydrolase [Mycobacterium kubicae]